MTPIEQFEIDFNNAPATFELMLSDLYAARQAADAKNWTEEAMAMVWSLGRNDWESWGNLPCYTRHQIVTAYRAEQEDLECWNSRFPDDKRTHIRTYRQACPPLDEKVMAARFKFAEEMAATLKADWAANRPPSVFTYEQDIAAMVGMILGIRYEAIAPRDLEELNNPKKRSKIQP